MKDLKLIKVNLIVSGKEDKQNILVPGSSLEKVISSSNYSATHPPIFSLPPKLPMIVKPKLYKSTTVIQPCSHQGDVVASGIYSDDCNCGGNHKGNDTTAPSLTPLTQVVEDNNTANYIQLGGYLLNDIEYTDKIILSNWELSAETKFLSKNEIFDMVNFINSVPFKINENVLDFILENNNKYNFYIDSNYIHPLTLKKKLTKTEAKVLESFYSKKFIEQNILGLASIYRVVPSFYLPVRLDYRGRLYCMVEYLNYQGIELAKSLLEFKIGEKIYLNDELSINYLKIFGANCFGGGADKLDKKSFNDRVA
jgi:hypothetical protein